MTSLPLASGTAATAIEARAEFYQRLAPRSMTPLWESLHALVPPEPITPVQPTVWRYAEVRPLLMESGDLISAAEAERRVLILENDGLRGQSSVTQSLYAGLQLILPGEVAPAHRHAQSALRLVLEGEGGYTTVDGERIPMHRGDFIITPAHTWHDHGHDGDEPVVWLDGLDIPTVRFYGAGFAEKATESKQPINRAQGDSLARFGHNLVPADYQASANTPAKLCHYPYDLTRAALTQMLCGEPDAHTGHKLRFVNPATGQSPMATIGTYIQALPAGFKTAPMRSTDSTVYCCLEGEGVARIGHQEVAFSERDIFVVPSWAILQFHAHKECVLFSYSDRPVQEALGLWKEERI